MNRIKNSKGFNLITVIIIICVTSFVSAITSGIIITNNNKNAEGVNYGTLIKDDKIKEFLDVYANILNNYYEDVDKEKMIDSAMDAMLNYLGDSYTTYMNKDERESLAEKLEGTYKGIGISIVDKVIKNVAKNSPAEAKGLLEGDIILKINETSTTNLSDSAIAALIKGKDNKNVKIKIKREDKELDFSMKTETLFTNSVAYNMIEETNIGYIGISIFSNTVSEQVKVALEDLTKKGMKQLIIDVRDDSGGYLEGAENIANQFLEKGKTIYGLEDKDGTTQYYDKTAEKKEFPLVVLMNKNSASASEILAASLKDSYNATLIGTKSYGKGKVQQTYNLSGGGMAKYTSAKWLRPTGECIDGVGLIPDINIEIEYTRDEFDNITGFVDTQLNKAVEFLSTK